MEPRPVINVEEFIVKTVGRRVLAGQKTGIGIRGVFRFKSHEEANEWMTKIPNRRKES